MPRRALFLVVIVALALISPAPLHAWQLDDLQLERVPIPSIWHKIQSQTSIDLDADHVPETLMLSGGHVVIHTKGQTRWQSPSDWQVKQAQITDLNHDGVPEVTLLVWRPFQPWPVDTWLPNGGRIKYFHNASGLSCHIILIGWKRGSFRELWAGSALAKPVKSFAAADLLGNNRQYLVTLTGEYEDRPSAPSRWLKVWEWNGFGFTVVHELADSSSLIVPVQTEEGRVVILTN